MKKGLSTHSDNSLNYAVTGTDKISGQGLALTGLLGFFMAWAIASHTRTFTPATHLLL